MMWVWNCLGSIPRAQTHSLSALALSWQLGPSRKTQNWPLDSHGEGPIPWLALGWEACSQRVQGGCPASPEPMVPQQWATTEPTSSTTDFSSAS